MGRKPNQLILEFFERGPKLEDSSNRYQHTCKSCGEKFPKGRIDSLNAHLLKKCPAISQSDRERAFLQMHDPLSFSQAGIGIGGSLKQIRGPSQLLDLPYHPDHNLSALETLAEVSRQHLDYAGDNVGGSGDMEKQRQSSIRSNEHHHSLSPNDFLVADEHLQHQDHSNVQVNSHVASTGESTEGYLPAIADFADHGLSSQSTHLSGFSLPTSGAPIAQMAPAQQLALTASAANIMIPNTAQTADGQPNFPRASKSSKGTQRKAATAQVSSAIDPLLQEGAQEQEQAKDDFDDRLYPRAIAINERTSQAHFTTDWSISQKPSRPKVRGRFTASRRKEVQEVRKQGACVRCRMLKKPCSGGTPCTTCESVESARLWKQPCIRTRIADEFDLYSAGLYTVLSFHEVSQAKGQVRLQPTSHQIAATHFPDTSSSNTILFSSLSGHVASANTIDPALQTLSGNSGAQVELLNQDDDDVVVKLDHYTKKTSRIFMEQEASDFMRPTLSLAAELCMEKMDPLLSRSLELWSVTHILADTDALWHLSTGPDMLSASAEPSINSIPLLSSTHPLSYRLITAQLHAFTEKRAAHLAKSLMNDLERRLLQRQQAQTQQFETFLIAIILLNCVEKMCWLFEVWHFHVAARREGQAQAQQGQSHHVRGAWPLDQQPASFVAKGERFSDLLAMILRMRGIPPKTSVNENGIIVVVDAVEDVVKTWYESISLRHDSLLHLQNGQDMDLANSRCWELKYISRLLLSGP